jgi:RNA polymerase sigma-70 factor (ECF subfamily)
MLRTAQQDRLAFSELYDRLAGVLFATALRILNDHKEAEDVLQEVFLQMWDRASEFDPLLGKPLSWAITLTRNKAIDRLRSAQRRSRLLAEVLDQGARGSGPQAGGWETVASNESSTLIHSALTALPPEQRQAIELAFFSGLTQMEIAETLRQPVGTIKARIRRGMLKLRDTLQEAR